MKQIDTLLLYISKDRTDIYSKLLDYQFDKEEELMQTNKNGKLKQFTIFFKFIIIIINMKKVIL